MDYQKHYDRLIQKARDRILDGYSETHHIVPKCLGGSDDPENLVDLTPEEHYVAHQLLVKIYPGNYRLVHAAVMMSAVGKTDRGNKCYGWLKRKQSVAAKQRTGEKNGSFGTVWVNDGIKSFKIRKDQPLNSNWSIGRINVHPLAKNTQCVCPCGKNTSRPDAKHCRECAKEFRRSNRKLPAIMIRGSERKEVQRNHIPTYRKMGWVEIDTPGLPSG